MADDVVTDLEIAVLCDLLDGPGVNLKAQVLRLARVDRPQFVSLRPRGTPPKAMRSPSPYPAKADRPDAVPNFAIKQSRFITAGRPSPVLSGTSRPIFRLCTGGTVRELTPARNCQPGTRSGAWVRHRPGAGGARANISSDDGHCASLVDRGRPNRSSTAGAAFYAH